MDNNTTLENQLPSELGVLSEGNGGMVSDALSTSQSPGLIARVIGRDESREIQRQQLSELQLGFEHRTQALRMAMETRMQAMEEMCNQALITGKAELRKERSEFFAAELLKLEQAMNSFADKFNHDADERLVALETVRHEALRLREEARLLRCIDVFHTTLDQLMDSFSNIINESINR